MRGRGPGPRDVRLLLDGVQHNDRYLPLGLRLILSVRRPELERLCPEPRAFFTGHRPGPCLHLLGPDLHLDIRVREDVAIPSGVLRCAAFGGNDEVAATIGSVEEWEHELLARLAADG